MFLDIFDTCTKSSRKGKKKKVYIYYSILQPRSKLRIISPRTIRERVRKISPSLPCHIQSFIFVPTPHIWCLPYLFMGTHEMVMYLQTSRPTFPYESMSGNILSQFCFVWIKYRFYSNLCYLSFITGRVWRDVNLVTSMCNLILCNTFLSFMKCR